MAQRAGEKSGEAGISGRRWWNLVLKPGSDLNVFWNVSMSNGIFHDGHVSGSAGRHRGGDFRPDGERVGGAAANRQFRLGRHHLDRFARPDRDLVAAARGSHCDSQRRAPRKTGSTISIPVATRSTRAARGLWRRNRAVDEALALVRNGEVVGARRWQWGVSQYRLKAAVTAR